jgi:hypothetical protein
MKKTPTHIDRVYLLVVEDPGDYYLKPEGVLFIDNLGNHTLYSADSRFNFLKSAVHKFPYQELEVGVTFREHQIRLDDVTENYEDEYDMIVDNIMPILHAIFKGSPRQYFFLEKHFQPNSTNSYYVP